MVSRRQVVMGGIAGAAAVASGGARAGLSVSALQRYRSLVPEVFVEPVAAPAYTPFLVIGSGFGGAVSALRLAQAGQTVTVLERGYKWPNDPRREIFSNDTLPDGRAFWRCNQAKMIPGNTACFDNFGGVMDISVYDNMQAWHGAAVGGGSVVFTGAMIQPDQRYFDAIFGGGVNYAEMNAVYYPRVRKMLNLSPAPASIYNSNAFGHARVWDAEARQAGYTPVANDSIFNWQVVQAEIAGASRASALVGLSNHGNSNGAKFDLNQNYLKQAEATGRAKVYAGHEVQGIWFDGSRYVVDVIRKTVDGNVLGRAYLSCDKLLLAAGSIGTSELLVKAQAKGGLTRLNGEVGRGWGGNGDAIALRGYTWPSGFTQASPSASRIHDPSGLPTTLENWYAPGFGADFGQIASLSMVFDQTHRGAFSYDAATDRVKLNWGATWNDDIVSATRLVNNRICNASGAAPGFWPIAADVFGHDFTAHPLGGAVLDKATDNLGRVVGHPGLYVMDGALIPGSTGTVNPSLTISALAERNIERIISAGR